MGGKTRTSRDHNMRGDTHRKAGRTGFFRRAGHRTRRFDLGRARNIGARDFVNSLLDLEPPHDLLEIGGEAEEVGGGPGAL